MGFIMSQKYCKCESITPICCSDGWKVCMVGSNFTSPAESNYAQIEGECLGVVNALKKTRYYTQGCEKLVVGANHKPLLGYYYYFLQRIHISYTTSFQDFT